MRSVARRSPRRPLRGGHTCAPFVVRLLAPTPWVDRTSCNMLFYSCDRIILLPGGGGVGQGALLSLFSGIPRNWPQLNAALRQPALGLIGFFCSLPPSSPYSFPFCPRTLPPIRPLHDQCTKDRRRAGIPPFSANCSLKRFT